MRQFFKVLTLISPVLLQGCAAPMIVGSGAFLGTTVADERGFSGFISDTSVSGGIKTAWFEHDPTLNERIGLEVHEGRALLTGRMRDTQQQIDAVRLAWTIDGVQEVIDETTIDDGTGGSFSEYASDTAITASIKSSMLFADYVNSGNYNIRTVDGVVFIIGIAQQQEELDRVIDIAGSADGVKNVISHVRLKGESIMDSKATMTAPATSKGYVAGPQPIETVELQEEPVHINSEPPAATAPPAARPSSSDTSDVPLFPDPGAY
ncbi:MAG: BON domain-containing protein [Alphaproteobacteria bacterium]